MPSDDLPVEVGRSAELFLTAVDESAPGLVTGFYLVGSVALGDFHPRGAGRGRLSTASDIDFVAVTDHRVAPGSREMTSLAEAHARTAARFPRPHFDGAVLTWTDLAAGPESCPDVPCAHESRFAPTGRSGVNPVTFCELAWHGIALRGPRPAELDVWADQDALRAYTVDNLNAYWRPWWRRNKRPHPVSLAIGLSAWFPVWAVLGVSRLHHLLATGTVTSQVRCRPVRPGRVRPALAAHRRREPVPAHRWCRGPPPLPRPAGPPPRHPRVPGHHDRGGARAAGEVVTAPRSVPVRRRVVGWTGSHRRGPRP